jgi:predicted permease
MPARIRSFWRSILHRDQVERDMADELQFHIELRTEDLMRAGLPASEARRRARVEFGAIERHKEEAREARGLRLLDELRGDLRYSWRQVAHAPVFSLLAVATLALGIGANTAMFSAIDAVMLRSLPVKAPEQLRRLEWVSRDHGFMQSYNGSMRPNELKELAAWSVSYPVYRHIRDNGRSFSDLITFTGFARLNLTIHGHAELASGELVSGNFFAALGTQAVIGRVLVPEDDRENAPAGAAVLSHGFWQRRFGADPAVVGQAIAVNGTPAVVVGVLQKGFCGVDPARCPDIVLPLARHQIVGWGEDILRNPGYWYFEVIGRLGEGVNEEKARAETEMLMRRAILDYKPKEKYDPPRIRLSAGGQGIDELRSEYRQPLKLLMCAVASVLLIACANLAGLLLVRSAARRREIGTRLAMGAGRWRLVRQLLTEGLLLAFLGGAAGMLLARYGGNAVVQMLAESDPPGVDVVVNRNVLGFSFVLCVFSGIIVGLAPAWRAARLDLLPLLKATGSTTDRARSRAGKVLIGVQVAFSLILVAGSALFVRTLGNLRSEPIGFEPESIVVFQLNPTLNGYREERLLDFHEQVLGNVSEAAGVTSASMSRWGLLAGHRTSDTVRLPGGEDFSADTHYVAPRLFETMGIPLLAGRDVSRTDRESSPPVLLVNEALAQRYLSGNPVGQTVELDGRRAEIVGVVGNTKFDSLREGVRPSIYVPFRQNPQHSMTYAVKSGRSSGELTSALRAAVEKVDRNVPMYEVKTQAEQISDLLRRERLMTALLSGFALLALMLSGLGVYATLAFFVACRTPELGVRLALGAQRRDVVLLVIRESAVPVLIGLACGVYGALESGSLIEKMLFGIEPQNPWALAAGSMVLLGCALAASLVPALRAAGIAPMQALRHE